MNKLEGGGNMVIVTADNVALCMGLNNKGKLMFHHEQLGCSLYTEPVPAENSPNILSFSLSQILLIHTQE